MWVADAMHASVCHGSVSLSMDMDMDGMQREIE